MTTQLTIVLASGIFAVAIFSCMLAALQRPKPVTMAQRLVNTGAAAHAHGRIGDGAAMRASKACDSPRAPAGQAYIYFALAIPVLCGMLALAVDVGTTTARYQALRHAADRAADAGAYALYGSRIGATTSLSDTGVWNAMASKLTTQGLTLMTAPGGAVPSNPCAAGYLQNQVAMTATYLDSNDDIITSASNTPWLVGSGSIPPLAWGVQVTLGTCQPAGFGGVLGHSSYAIWVNGSAGRWLPGPMYTPTTAAGSAPFMPYAASAAPNGNCNGVNASNNYTPTIPPSGLSPDNGDPQQFYCKNAYAIGSSVTLYANGVGLGNNYGYDASFKGYEGGVSTIGAEGSVGAGGGNNAPASCPSPATVPIVSGVHHIGNSEYFVVLEYIVVNFTQCGNPTTATILSVWDPYGYGVVTPAATPTPTNTPAPIPVTFRSSATAGTITQTTSLPISVPAGIQTNDVLLAQVAVQNDSIPITAPSGWTQVRLDQQSGGGIMQGLYYHVVTGSEPVTYTWSWGGTGSNASGAIAAYYGEDPNNPINSSGGTASSGPSNTITAPGITTTVNNAMVIGFFGAQAGITITVPSSETARWAVQSIAGGSSGQNSSTAGGDALQATAGATGAFIATLGGSQSQNNVGQLVALQPAPPAPTPTPLPPATPTPTLPPLPTVAPPVVHGAL